MSYTNWVILSYGCHDIVSIAVTKVSQCHCDRILLWFQKRGFPSKAEWWEEGTTVTISPCEPNIFCVLLASTDASVEEN